MGKLGFLAICITSLLAAALSPASAKETAGPRLVLKENTFDFGSVEEGSTLEHAFKAFNRGSEPLLIKKVSPG